MAASMEPTPGGVGDLKIVMGAATYGHCAGVFRSANAGDRAALEDLMASHGWRQSLELTSRLLRTTSRTP